jgi:amino acid transporter
VFARIHDQRRSPWVGLIFSSIVVMTLLVAGTLITRAGGLDLVARLATVTVVFLLFIYALVIVSALKLRGQDESEKTFRANTGLLLVGLVGNAVLLGYVVYDDPTALWWCLALVGVGVVLFLVEYLFGRRDRPEDVQRGDPSLASER